MNLETLNAQYHKHGSVQFRNFYGVSQQSIYLKLGFMPEGSKGIPKEKMPDDGLTIVERRDLFHRLTGNPEYLGYRRLRKKQESYDDTVIKVENYKENYVKPDAYTGRFAEFMNRF